METIKVIVDEIVDECAFCPFLHRVDNSYDENGRIRYLCVASNFKRTYFNIEGYKRPNWCPLITQERLMMLWQYAETGDWDYESEEE